MEILFATVFVASLLGSLHCVGMCGPFALLAGSDNAASKNRQSSWGPVVAYSLGRLITYSIVGFIFGCLGMALNKGTSFAFWQQSATWVAGGLMVLVGLIALARHLGIRVPLPKVFRPVQLVLGTAFTWARGLPRLQKAITIGALTSLMPCGWLYTFAITAAGTGSPWLGMAVMAVFWSGTVPIMAALMMGFNRIGKSIQRQVPVLMASLVILIGMFTLVFRAPVAIGGEVNVLQGAENLAEQINDVDQTALPCCQHYQEARDAD